MMQGNMLPKEHGNPSEPEPEPELKEVYEMADTEFKIMIVIQLNETQENTDKGVRKSMSDSNEKYYKGDRIHHYKYTL